jgi:choline transporter-like protein 2/4/5
MHVTIYTTVQCITDSCIVTGCYASYVKYDELGRAKEVANEVGTRSFPSNTILEPAQQQVDEILQMKGTWLVFLIISAVLLVVVLLMLIFLRSRIRIAVALIKEASK